MIKNIGGTIIVLFVLFLWIDGSRSNIRKEKAAIWKAGYYEGYDDAREGIGENSINFGPDEMPDVQVSWDGESWESPNPSKSDYELQYEAYLAGWRDFKVGQPYNANPPE